MRVWHSRWHTVTLVTPTVARQHTDTTDRPSLTRCRLESNRHRCIVTARGVTWPYLFMSTLPGTLTKTNIMTTRHQCVTKAAVFSDTLLTRPEQAESLLQAWRRSRWLCLCVTRCRRCLLGSVVAGRCRWLGWGSDCLRLALLCGSTIYIINIYMYINK